MWRFTRSNLLQRPVRTVLTLLAIALAVALVVATTSGYASAEKTVREFVTLFLGNSDLQISADAGSEGLDERILREVRSDPDVRNAFGRFENSMQFKTADGSFTGINFSVLGVDPAEDEYFARLPLSYGRKFTAPDANEVVIDQGARRVLGLDVGDELELPGPGGPRPLRIVGVVHKPEIIAAMVQSVYVPVRVAQETLSPEQPGRLTKIVAEYELDVDGEAVVAGWQERLEEGTSGLNVSPVRAQREAIDQGLRGLNLASLMGGTIALLAAAFIVFGTLSMGVAERGRTLAMLRAIGGTTRQLQKAVLVEGVLLAIGGILLGIPAGLLFILGLTRWYSSVFTAGMGIGWLGLGVAAVGMALAAIIASLLPAWNASRVEPLAAMRPSAQVGRTGAPLGVFAAGIGLVCIDIVLLWPSLGVTPLPLQWEKNARFWLHIFVGLPTLLLGFFLIAPMAIWLIEKSLAGAVARLFLVQPVLLRQQLSTGLWRAAGTASALMVGLAVLIVMNSQGRSAIEGWQIPDKFPDVFLYDFGGISPEDLEAIKAAPGIRKLEDGAADLTPIGYFNPLLGDNVFAMAGAAFQPDRTMFVAIDPRRVFDLMELQFTAGDESTATRMLDRGRRAILEDGREVDGTFETTADGEVFRLLRPDESGRPVEVPASAVEESARGRYLIITEEFHELRGTTVGDPFELKRRGEGVLGRLRGETVEFTVVGVVQSPGIDVMVATFDLGRQFQTQSAASVFGTLDDAREVFGVKAVRLIAANLDIGVDKEQLVEQLTAELGRSGISVADVRQIKHDVQTGLSRLLLVASTVAWAALAVASLGVVNTIMAGIRARLYQMGILRAIGVTRWGIVRLIVAEAVLLGGIACTLGVAAGVLMTLNARQLQAWVVGYVPPLQMAWDVIATGIAVIALVSVGAALVPAIQTGRTDVLRMLQQGRSAI